MPTNAPAIDRIEVHPDGPSSQQMLRILATQIFLNSLGRGVFLALTVLYFTLIVGLSVTEIAVILTVSSALGVATSWLGGSLADRVSAKRLLLALLVVEGLALLSYAFASSFMVALVIACVVNGASSSSKAVRATIVGRAFEGEVRIRTRAILLTVGNVGIALGGAAASIPLLLNVPDAYRLTIGIAGFATLISAARIAALPRRVDALVLSKVDRAASAHLVGRSPWRDPRYLGLAALSALFGIQFGLAEIGLPLWVLHHTEAPVVVVSIALIVNTVLVVALQIPLSRGSHDIRRAGKAVSLAGLFMAIACAVYAASAGVSPVLALALILAAAVAHTFGEILSSAGIWGLSYELADPRSAGAYQGLFAMAFSIGTMVTPAVIAVTVVDNGTAGWVVLGVIFLASSAGIRTIAHRASSSA
ncbi:MFS family permease [Cryobacterium sp. MP_M5]|uniref:MFS transporter n=1 Tax=unclassified Cryobacterium TaxID=2649013 RepID=UPI0018C9C671|nr:MULTISPECIES: MFS transporter [unclassified Cryobacterium]MBG6058238.1 MFS family permease [Cryobacterium sp. MP_M3]MEC5176515.1 MFS family permease [Cryobacterium sp. MP_M5]